MPTTTKGLRYPAPGDNNDTPTDIQELATDVNDRLHIALTTAQINALAGADLWVGRTIFDITLGVLKAYNGATWQTIGATDVISPTIVDAKGDLIVATGPDAVARHVAGSN